MIATQFTPVPALLGGMLIGVSATLLWIGLGRTAGISGILGGLATARGGNAAWRTAFLVGLMAGSALYQLAAGPVATAAPASGSVLILGGALVGFGTRLGSGCTSGHGVCGIARLSRRSLVATALFVGSAMATVAMVRHVMRG
jgi:uncharacterized membrane protein YedE/YeeE